MRVKALHATDYYKVGHVHMNPAGTESMYANFTCRSDRWAKDLLPPTYDRKVVVPGLQGIAQWLLIDLWNETFFSQPLQVVLDDYRRRVESGLGIAGVSLEHVERLHKLGYLPVRIKELPPGSRVSFRIPLFTIQDTQPGHAWIVEYLETQLSAEYWKMVTNATIASEYRKMFLRYADMTGVHPEFTRWQGHDFSMRGMAGIHDATQCGAAHLMSFCGTDTVSAIDYLEQFYAATGLIGGSVFATEHSVMQLGIAQPGGELGLFKRLLTEVVPKGILSVVSDTLDFWRVLTEYLPQLKADIMARDGKLVIRPDSGDPVRIICGEALHCKRMPTWQEADVLVQQGWNHVEVDGKYFALMRDDAGKVNAVTHLQYPEPALKGAVRILHEIFGGTETDTGHIQLDSHIGLIYGDSINLQRAREILALLNRTGYSSGNIVFGIGSYTYQHVTRDTFGTAIKATSGVVNGTRHALFKDPATDSGVKKSARGLLRVEQNPDGEFLLHEEQTEEQETQGVLQTIFENGRILNPSTLDQVRNRLHSGQF